MDRRVARPVALLAGLLVAGVASAGEVVQFTEFRHLMIESHEVHGDFIRVRFDGGGVMLLPAFRVDSIKRGERIVYDSRPPGERLALESRRQETDDPIALDVSLDASREPARVASLPPPR